MSDSPKCSSPRLREDEERRLQAERQRLAAEQEARREAEAERRRMERVRQLRLVEELRSRRRAALEALTTAEGVVAGLQVDDVVMRWQAAAVRGLADVMVLAASRIEAGDFVGATAQSASVTKEALVLVKEAQERQLTEDRRQYIVQGLITVMARMGFVISSNSPRRNDPSLPASDILINARRLGGGGVAVSVPLQGDVWYDVDGFPKRREARTDGTVIATCDEAENEINNVHVALARDFGIQMSELTWAGKPTKIDRHAEALPRREPEKRGRT